MKKKLLVALLTSLLLLLAASTALAADYSDYTCTSCGNPCEAWYPLASDGFDWHAPICYSCGIFLRDEMERCTPVDGSATCKFAPRCSVCTFPMSTEYEPDPDAHRMGESWSFTNEKQHFRVCQNSCGKTEYADHTGGTATCTERAVCEVCNSKYGELSDANHGEFSDWMLYDDTQHYHFCIECVQNQEFGNHTGGTATCASMATCEVCHAPYGIGNPANHGELSKWSYYSPEQHIRYCKDCGTPESFVYGSHADNTGDGLCDDCDYTMPVACQHTNMSDWALYSSTQHYRWCLDCDDAASYEYGEHTGGTATCTSGPVCTICDSAYGSLDENAHAPSTEWSYYPVEGYEDVHVKSCTLCNAVMEEEAHWGGTATCKSQPICEVCSAPYGIWSSTHSGPFTAWEWTTFNQHWHKCETCGVYETEDHTGGTATCGSGPICEVCGDEYGKPNNNHTGGEATCASGPICTECGNEYGEPNSNHIGPFGEWENITVDQHWRKCATCEWYEYADHTGGTATCAATAVCDVCHENYGFKSSTHTGNLSYEYSSEKFHYKTCDVCNQTHAEKHTGGTATCESGPICDLCETAYGESLGGHDYVAVVTDPTCTKKGYTTYTCSRCKDSYKADHTAARSHWYDLWAPNLDGTHSAECKRYGCNYVGTTECTLFEITVKDSEADILLTVCPVCGDHGEMPFAAILDAAIKAVDRYSLPRGEQIVRGMDAPFDGVLYAFTAAYELAGKVEPFKGTVSVTLPLDAEKYTEFRLVRVDVIPATETTERTETWTDIPFTYEDGKLIFETDTAGLFLLIPMQ